MVQKHQAHGLEEAERRAEAKRLYRKKVRRWFCRAFTLSSAAGLIDYPFYRPRGLST
jgi:hypothetical protein